MEFSRQENLGGLPFLFPGTLPDPGIEPASQLTKLTTTEKKKGKQNQVYRIRSIYCGVLKGTDKYKIYVPALGPENRGKIYVPCLPDLYHVHRCTMSSRSVLDTSAILEMLDLFSTLLTMCS